MFTLAPNATTPALLRSEGIDRTQGATAPGITRNGVGDYTIFLTDPVVGASDAAGPDVIACPVTNTGFIASIFASNDGLSLLVLLKTDAGVASDAPTTQAVVFRYPGSR